MYEDEKKFIILMHERWIKGENIIIKKLSVLEVGIEI